MYIKSYRGKYEAKFVEEMFPTDLTENDFVFVDEQVWELHLKELKDSIIENGLNVFLVDPNEYTKTLKEIDAYINHLTVKGIKKNSRIFVIGGGVLQDTFSFLSSILFRGIDWVFYPTTMLAQCDSCIGSKTSINYSIYKNLLGGFYPAKEVRINTNFLKTLPDSEVKSGIGEMLHYFLLNHKYDISERMVNESNLADNIDEYIEESLSIKKKMIEKDEFDKGERNLFNYGHTFGHAIEAETFYDVNHGQAVTMGMKIANRLSLKKGILSQDKYDRLEKILDKNLPNYEIKNIDKYIEALKKDKKNVSDELTCILLTDEYGIKTQVTYEEVKNVIESL